MLLPPSPSLAVVVPAGCQVQARAKLSLVGIQRCTVTGRCYVQSGLLVSYTSADLLRRLCAERGEQNVAFSSCESSLTRGESKQADGDEGRAHLESVIGMTLSRVIGSKEEAELESPFEHISVHSQSPIRQHRIRLRREGGRAVPDSNEKRESRLFHSNFRRIVQVLLAPVWFLVGLGKGEEGSASSSWRASDRTAA